METKRKYDETPAPFHNPTLYRSLVGKLQYLTLTRPDITFSVDITSRFMTNPFEVQFVSLNRILRYLKGTADYGLRILILHLKPLVIQIMLGA